MPFQVKLLLSLAWAQPGLAQPRGRSPPALASRHHHGDQYFAAGAGPLGGRVAGRREAHGAIAEAVSRTASHGCGGCEVQIDAHNAFDPTDMGQAVRLDLTRFNEAVLRLS